MIVSRAHVSRQTFYELYDDKEDCYDAVALGFIRELASVEELMDRASTWDTFEDALRVGFETLAAEPKRSHCLFLEPPAGLRALNKQRTPMRSRIRGALDRLTDAPSDFALDALTAMVRQTIEDHLVAGRIAELPRRSAELTALLAAGTARPRASVRR